MFFKQWLHSSIVRFALIAVVLLGVTLIGARSTGQAKAASAESIRTQPSEQSDNSIMSTNPAGVQDGGSVICQNIFTSIRLNQDLLLVGCTNRVDGNIFTYGIHGAESKAAARVLAIVLAAKALNSQNVVIEYNTTPSTVPSCDQSNCRELLWIGF